MRPASRELTRYKLKQLIRSLPLYADIKRGETENTCIECSEEVLERLVKAGADAIMVQARNREGEPVHHFILCMVSEFGEKKAVIVDPTISQFYPHYRDVFIGSREEMQAHFADSSQGWQTFEENWPSRLHLYIPEKFYPRLGNPSPLEEDPRLFQEKWGRLGVIQQERHTAVTTGGGGRYLD